MERVLEQENWGREGEGKRKRWMKKEGKRNNKQ